MPADNSLPNMGFAQYCMNCHASAANNLTFASPKNMQGEPGEPLVFLSQDFFTPAPAPSSHELAVLPGNAEPRLGNPLYAPDADVIAALRAYTQTMPSYDSVSQDAVGDLRQHMGGRRRRRRGGHIRHVEPVPRLPRCRQHRAAVRHDQAEPAWRQPPQPVALRDVADVADGAGRPRPDLLRAARQRDAELPSRRARHGAGYLPRLPRHRRPAPVPHRRQGEDGPMHRLHARNGQCGAVAGRQSERRACQLRHAGPRRHHLHHMPPHGAQHRGQRTRSRARRRMPASTSARRCSIRRSPALPGPSPAASWSAPRTS